MTIFDPRESLPAPEVALFIGRREYRVAARYGRRSERAAEAASASNTTALALLAARIDEQPVLLGQTRCYSTLMPEPTGFTPNVHIVVPAYNEASALPQTITDLKKHGWVNITVVDDGSTDTTADQAKAAGADVLSLPINRGQGAALQAGMSYIAKQYTPDIIVTFDADGQHLASDVATLIEPLKKNAADITLGSRFLDPASNVPFTRKVILKLGVIFTNLISNTHLTDTHNGLRALNKRAYQRITITQRGMEHASEIIDQLRPRGLRYTEVPVTIRYFDERKANGQKTSNFLSLGINLLIKKFLS